MKFFTTILLLAIGISGVAQSHPKNLKQAVKQLDKETSADFKSVVKATSNDSLIYLVYPWGGKNKTMSDWLGDSLPQKKLMVYFEKNGIYIIKEQESVILQAFKSKLLNGAFNEKQILLPFQAEAKRRKAEDAVRYTTDSLNGIYIPKNLDDTYARLDVIWKDDLATKKQKIADNLHFSLGMWMRNNWSLWGGSRLSQYFNDLGIHHPDDMSGIILDGYESYLNNTPFDLDAQIKHYQDYWEESKKKSKAKADEEFAQYNVGDTVYFDYTHGYISKDQEKKHRDEVCTAQGIIIEKEYKYYNIKVRLIKACDKKGIIASDNLDSYTYNEKTKVYERPKKRKIIKIKEGDTFWFHYQNWETEDN